MLQIIYLLCLYVNSVLEFLVVSWCLFPSERFFLRKPTKHLVFLACVGLSLPISSFIPSHPSRKTYYIANFPSLRRFFSVNILFYHFAFSSTDLLIYIITIIVYAFPKYYLMPMIILTLPSWLLVLSVLLYIIQIRHKSPLFTERSFTWL